MREDSLPALVRTVEDELSLGHQTSHIQQDKEVRSWCVQLIEDEGVLASSVEGPLDDLLLFFPGGFFLLGGDEVATLYSVIVSNAADTLFLGGKRKWGDMLLVLVLESAEGRTWRGNCLVDFRFGLVFLPYNLPVVWGVWARFRLYPRLAV